MGSEVGVGAVTIASVICAACAVVVALWPAPGAMRMTTILGNGVQTSRAAAAAPQVSRRWGPDAGDGLLASARGRAAASLCAALAGLMLVGGAAGVVLAAVVGVGAWHALRGIEPRSRVRDRKRVVAMLPLATDLVAAALTAGCPPVVAVQIVGDAIGGPLGRALVDTAAASGVGADPARAWADLAADPAVRPLARALASAMSRGTAPGPALRRVATDARDAVRWAGEARARSLGARAAAPLGLCFLPAFVLLGVVPVVATSGVLLP